MDPISLFYELVDLETKISELLTDTVQLPCVATATLILITNFVSFVLYRQG